MTARSCWKGFLKLSLVAVPVKAYSATVSGGGDIHLHQLHADCHSRIRYHKVCPLHGQVAHDAIVSGYEYTKGQYVVVDTAELDQLRSADDKALTIAAFIAPEALDPLYASGKSYYLLPDGPVGHKPYAVLAQGMRDLNRHAIAQVVLHGREQIVLLRPLDRLLVLTVLQLDQQITKPATFRDEVPAPEVAAEELQLARTLIEASTPAAWDFSCYQDVYTAKLSRLIEAKVAGEEIVAAPVPEHPQVINLMEALRQSVAQITHTETARPAANGQASKKTAPSTRGRTSAARKRKSS
jgi:DNA end-binding protein Ku